MPQFGLGQPACEGPILPPVPLLIDQQSEPFLETQLGDPGLLRLGAKGLGHAVQAQGVQLLEGRLIQHECSSPGPTAPSGSARGQSRKRREGSSAPAAVGSPAPPKVGGRANVPESTSRSDRNRLRWRLLAPRPLPDARSNSAGPAEECLNRIDSPSPGAVYFPGWRRTTEPWPVPPTSPN